MKRKNLLIILLTIICLFMISVCFGVIQQGSLYANQNKESITRNAEVKANVNVIENVKVPSAPDLTRNIDHDNLPEDPWCCWRLIDGQWKCGPCS